MGGQDLDRDGWMGTGKAFLTAFPDGAHEFQDVIMQIVGQRCAIVSPPANLVGTSA
jgi:hypothetical protein